jgi:hypothetical protein
MYLLDRVHYHCTLSGQQEKDGSALFVELHGMGTKRSNE